MLKDIFLNEMINTILTFGELAESKLPNKDKLNLWKIPLKKQWCAVSIQQWIIMSSGIENNENTRPHFE